MKTEFIDKELATVIKEATKYFSVITITGPRQSGKTTLLQNIFGELPYFSLENLDIQKFAINDPVAFLNVYFTNFAEK
jgi:uncharacterized protein